MLKFLFLISTYIRRFALNRAFPMMNQLKVEELHNLYIAVGQGISTWSVMEDCVIRIASVLLGSTPENTGLVFYYITNFYTWLSIIDELFTGCSEYSKLSAKWTKISSKLRELNDVRVRLAHHMSLGSENDESITLRPSQLDIRTKSKKQAPLSPMEILDFISSLNKVIQKLIALKDELSAFDTSQKKSS